MAYRFTDTDKWKDVWFIELDPLQKLMFNYLCDNCDIAGFYELSLRKMKADLHFTDDQVKQALKGIEKAYILSRDKRILFLKNFIKHQKNFPLNRKNKAHIGIIYRIENYQDKFAHDILKMANKGTKPPQDKAKLKGLQSTLSIGIDNIEFIEFWNLYGKKVGNRDECKKKWDLLTPKVQKHIIADIPGWKALTLQHQTVLPYPETYLNQKRWNDDIEQVTDKPKFPNHYDPAIEKKLNDADALEYYKHLRAIGYERITAQSGYIAGWKLKKQAS